MEYLLQITVYYLLCGSTSYNLLSPQQSQYQVLVTPNYTPVSPTNSTPVHLIMPFDTYQFSVHLILKGFQESLVIVATLADRVSSGIQLNSRAEDSG